MLVEHEVPLEVEIDKLGATGRRAGPRAKADNGPLIAAYLKHGSVWKAAAALGMCGQTVHRRLMGLGITKPINIFSEEEKAVLREQYQAAADAGRLSDLAAAMGRTKPFICRQARALGMTDQSRTRAYLKEQVSAANKAWHAANEHPRGMLGKKHSQAVCEAVAKAGRDRWAAMSDAERDAQTIKQIKARAKAGGGKLIPDVPRPGVSWKQAWREIGGQRAFFRSAWEANYARYLELLRTEGKILKWEHEPHTFWFEGIARGTVCYIPDFRVTALDGTVTWHEVKGWMDERSKLKLARMAKYHPDVAMVVIDKKVYGELKTLLRFVIDGWEA